MKGTDIRQKGIEIKLDKTRHMIFDLNAFCELEDKFGDIQKAFSVLDTGSMKGIRTVLYAGLLHEDETLTEKKVGQLITMQNITEVSEIMAKALSEAMPEVDGNIEVEDTEERKN